MKVLCSICARGGSQGVPDKNIKELAGKPLILHTVEQAVDAACFDKIVVSSDSERILSVVENSGVDYLVRRPETLATEHSAKIPVIRHLLDASEREFATHFDVVVDLAVTTPLRSADDIRSAVTTFLDADAANLVSATLTDQSPYFNVVEVDEKGRIVLSKPLGKPLTRRQDAPKCFSLNGAIYIWRRDVLSEEDRLLLDDTILFELPQERSIDIDTAFDFSLVDALLFYRTYSKMR
ncbi:MAG: posttranslational modification protein [marine bacterium B5-7]|nr:MAG: posttranslational modification protein [marine bacterium B5-7]